MMVRELGFEMKAQPSEKLKTPEELAREEREKLQKLEVMNTDSSHPRNKPNDPKGLALAFETSGLTFPDALRFLQADRLRRMVGEELGSGTQQQVHMSADDLNDGFVLDSDDKKTLAYQVRGPEAEPV